MAAHYCRLIMHSNNCVYCTANDISCSAFGFAVCNKYQFYHNQMIVLPPLLMHLVDEDNSVKSKLGRSLAYSFLNSVAYTFYDKNTTIKDKSVCKDHDHEILKPHLTSTWMPNAIGSMPGKSVIFAEAEVSMHCTNWKFSLRALSKCLLISTAIKLK